MVNDHTPTIDSASVMANATIATLELKVTEDELGEHLRKVRAISAMDKEVQQRIHARSYRPY